ncbi:MAG: hypothetical protein QM572_13335 [Nocardioides sp.]|uniref:hypothetical protein n=1 Tax=Nocardioides sp. TaxID=35761 RepID=UPI0039E60400
MAHQVVLHIGAMKTGTTYLQAVLRGNPAALATTGHLDARTLGRPAGAVAKVLARPYDATAAVAWHELCRRIREAPAETVVVSTEYLGFARPHQIEALLAPLAGLSVRVVLAVRDQVGAIPSQWQTFCRNYGDDRWPDYLAHIDPDRAGDRRSKAWRSYHRAQDLDRIARDWSTHPGVGLLHVLTLPHTRTESRPLWRAFALAAGLEQAEVVEPAPRVNPSVGHASAQMLQDLGRHWQRAGHPIHLVRLAMRRVIAEALVPRRRLEPVPRLDRRGWAFARRRNELAVAALEEGRTAGRLTVHGSLADLVAPDPPPDLPGRAADADPTLVREAARALWLETRQSAGASGRPPLTYRATLRAIADLAPRTEAWRRTADALGRR